MDDRGREACAGWRLRSAADVKQFRRGVAPEEGVRDGVGLAEGSLDSFQEQIEMVERSADATKATMRSKMGTKVPCEVSDLEKEARC